MKVYVVMVCDRHTDPGAHVFTTPEKAIDYARAEVEELAHFPDAINERPSPPDGWLYLATYSDEGDSVWVLEKELDGSAPNAD